jgi:hypothetical protein
MRARARARADKRAGVYFVGTIPRGAPRPGRRGRGAGRGDRG